MSLALKKDAPQSGYKQTELGLIPEDWEVKSIEEIANCLDNLRVPLNGTEREKLVGDIPYCGANGILGYVDDFVIDDDIILMAEDGGYFDEFENRPIAYRMIGKCWVNNHAHILKSKKGTHQGYLFYSLVHKNILKYLASGTRAKLNKSEMNKIEIVLPKIEQEQKAIAEALGDVDAYIAALEKLIAKKRNIKQGAMQDLLTGKKRLEGFDGEWSSAQIGSIAPLQRGFDLPNSMLRIGTFPVVYSNGIMNYHQNYMVRAPGVVTGRTGTIGKIHFIESDFWPHNTSLWVTRFNGNNPKFIYYLYDFIGFERFSSGSGVPTLNRNDAHSFNLKMPSCPKEQEAIAKILTDMDSEISTLETKLEKAKQIKQGMMQDLLSGKVRLI